MKRTILVTIILAAILGAVEIVPVIGGNYQFWMRSQEDYREQLTEYTDHGLGGHGGVTIDVSFYRFGLETGLLYQYAHYKRLLEDEISAHWRFNNLLVPGMMKYRFVKNPGIESSIGVGAILIHNISGKYYYSNCYHPGNPVSDQMLATRLGALCKLETGFHITPKLMLKPAITIQYNTRPDVYGWWITETNASEISCFVSVGFGFNL